MNQAVLVNEIADQLANQDAAAPLTRTTCGIAKSHLMAEVMNWNLAQLKTRWMDVKDLRQAKIFIKYCSKFTKKPAAASLE